MGMVNLRGVLEKLEAEPEIELAPEADSLDLLQAVYRNPDQPLHTRIRCAAMALPFERPKLAVTAMINSEDFADRLDKAVARSRNARAVEFTQSGLPLPLPRSGPSIEHDPSELMGKPPGAIRRDRR